MYTTADLRKDLPSWPEEVLEQWILPFANDDNYGWSPFRGTAKPRWRYLIPAGLSFADTASISWSKSSIETRLPGIAPLEIYKFSQMAQWYFHDVANEYAHIDGGKQRFERLLQYVQKMVLFRVR